MFTLACGGGPNLGQRLKKLAEEHSHHDCDFRDMLSRVGDKWSLLVIFILKGRPAFRGRFSDLKRAIPGISQRMLTATVRNLERDGMLTRHVYAEVPPRVERSEEHTSELQSQSNLVCRLRLEK